MKSTGIVRKVDDLGRIVIPKELRDVLNLAEKDPVEIFLQNDLIVFRKFKPAMTCAITETVSDNNHKLLDGDLILSPEGLKILSNEISELLSKRSK